MQNYVKKAGVTQARNHDLLGYVDKDVEAVFAADVYGLRTTISNMDIYSDAYLDDKEG